MWATCGMCRNAFELIFNLNTGKNLFVVSSILIPGIGGLSVSFADGKVTLTTIACALILGIVTNTILAKGKED